MDGKDTKRQVVKTNVAGNYALADPAYCPAPCGAGNAEYKSTCKRGTRLGDMPPDVGEKGRMPC